MIKKIRNRLKERAEQRHLDWAKDNMPTVTRAYCDNIIWQMWRAGIKFDHINKWLMWRKLDPIRYYVVVNESRIKIWRAEAPTPEERAHFRNLSKDIVSVGI